MDHLIAGKRDMFVQDIPAAVDNLAMACEMLSMPLGETSTECADAYFHYGKALLEMSRLESDVLGNALEGLPEGEDCNNSQVEDPEEMSVDEKEEIGGKVRDALAENFMNHEEKIALLSLGHTKKMHEAEEDWDSHDEDANGEEEDSEKCVYAIHADAGEDNETIKNICNEIVEKEVDDNEEQEDEEEEDPSNLQLAWEMLELAKIVYKKKVEEEKEEVPKLEYEKKLCETFLLLGEVSMENENYPQAVDDLAACLKRRRDKLPNDSRSIAEALYQLGVALGFQGRFDEAVKSLKEAMYVLNARITNLEKSESKDETREKEIHELEKLLPEIRDKIMDTHEMKAQSMKAESIRKKAELIRRIQATDGFSSGSISYSCSGDEPVSMITAKKTHLFNQGRNPFSIEKSRMEDCS